MNLMGMIFINYNQQPTHNINYLHESNGYDLYGYDLY